MRIKEKARAINAYSQRSSLTANKNLFLKRKCHELNLASLRGGYKDESGEPLTPSQTLSIRYYKRLRAKSQHFFLLTENSPQGCLLPAGVIK